jgi:two-component system nitrate/nitrite response regulator NarL
MEPVRASVEDSARSGDLCLEPGAVTRVVLADDHPLFLAALRAVLERAGIEVVGSATRGDRLLAFVAELRPDAVLLDIEMPGIDGMTCLRTLRWRWPEIRVVVVSGHEADEQVAEALAAGAAAFVGKTVDVDELTDLLRPASAKAAGRTAAAGVGLTKREVEILRLAAEGHSNATLARMLWVVEPTVKYHLSNAYRKLGVANRTQAAARARALGLLRDQPRRVD